ncbi:unnamed protein product, partial [Callosobruchus maculatus]
MGANAASQRKNKTVPFHRAEGNVEVFVCFIHQLNSTFKISCDAQSTVNGDRAAVSCCIICCQQVRLSSTQNLCFVV